MSETEQTDSRIELHHGKRVLVDLPGQRRLSVIHGTHGDAKLWVIEFTVDEKSQTIVLPDDGMQALANSYPALR